MRVALVGAGRVGTAVAALLQNAGHDIVGIASRTADSEQRASQRLGASVYPIAELPSAELVLIGASDGSIEEAAAEIPQRALAGSFVCHFAGALGIAPLASVVRNGARGCAIHPVQACPSFEAAMARLPGSAWGVTCTDEVAEESMLRIIRDDLAGNPVVLSEAVRPQWHAACVMTSNGAAALLAAGESVLADIGIEDPTAVLGPLAAGTIENAREGGGGGATLTGPLVRGEKATLRRHIAALMDRPGGHYEAYKLISLLVVREAQEAGRIDAVTAASILREFGP